MFGFVKQIFISAMMFSGWSLPSVSLLKCISMTNQECKVRPEIANVNSDEPVLYPFSIKTNNAVVVLTISMIHMRKCVFVML